MHQGLVYYSLQEVSLNGEKLHMKNFLVALVVKRCMNKAIPWCLFDATVSTAQDQRWSTS